MRAAYTVIQRVKGGDAGGDAGEAVRRGPGEDKEAEVDSEIEVDSKLDQLIDDDEDWEGGGGKDPEPAAPETGKCSIRFPMAVVR